MNREETHALFAQGRDAWNAWVDALFAEQAALQKAGTWQTEQNGLGTLEAKNRETWLWFFKANADFSSVDSPHTFAEPTDFSNFKFPGDAHFERSTFKKDVKFGSVTFPGKAVFDRATFTGFAWFSGVTFTGNAWFQGATFKDEVGFANTTFTGAAWFDGTTFEGVAGFESAAFKSDSLFRGAKFTDAANFPSATFTSFAAFQSATFTNIVFFREVQFKCKALFAGAAFSSEARFDGVTFGDDAWFDGASFGATKERVPTLASTFFVGATFLRSAQFRNAHFYGPVSFENAQFSGEPDFSSLKSDVGLTLSGAHFARIPNFLQAELHREPRLDNIRIGEFESRWLSWVPQPFPQLNWRTWHVASEERDGIAQEPGGFSTYFKLRGRYHRFRLPFTVDRDAPAKIREMKRYAIMGQDSAREMDFHALEVRKSRFVSDYPWHLRFWFGMLYAATSNFGRSLLRPFALWCVLLLVSAAIYLLNSPAMIAKAVQPMGLSWFESTKVYADNAITSYLDKSQCVTFADAPHGVGRRALAPDVANATSLAGEALHLSFLNASVIGSFSADNARRTYGCLYGLESDASSNTFPIVPSVVADIGALQRLASAILIFLFGMAVRNMLKLK